MAGTDNVMKNFIIRLAFIRHQDNVAVKLAKLNISPT